MRILLVEDDTLLAQVLSDHLTAQHYTVDTAIDGATGLEFAQSAAYDLIVLDVNLPKLNGIRLCELLRQNRCTMPILLLTAKGDSSDKVIGLDSGADDYVVKPCTVEEISARIRALLRRLSPDKAPILSWGNLSLNPVTCEVTSNEQPLSLSAKEYSLLELLLRNPQRVFSSSNILEHLWSFEDAPSEETIRSHIKRLRRKLKASGSDDPIDTVYGIGYRLKPPPAPFLSPSTPNLDSPENQARAAAVALWEQFKQPILERIAYLDRAVAALEAGHLPTDLQEDATQAAHKLAGSLAMFGFSAGTQLGRDLEQLLSSSSPTAAAIKPLVEELHQVLASPATSSTPLPALLSTTLLGTSADPQSGNICSEGANPQVKESLSEQLASGELASRELASGQLASGQPCSTAIQSPLPLSLLMVDSDVDLAKQLQQLGENLGVEVSIMPDLAQARSSLSTCLPDAVLLELGVEEKSEAGLKFLEELSQQFPELPLIVFTVQDNFEHRMESVRRGCRCFLSKSMPLTQVISAVQNVLNREAMAPIKVLAVDDDLLTLNLLLHCSRNWGISMTTLNCPEQFWQTLEQVQPDLVVLDVQMPAISGIELCQVVRSDRNWHHLPILFLTAQQEPDAILAIYRAGADDCMSKPFREIDVMTRIFNRVRRTRLLKSGSSEPSM
ncbi:response regulator [Leptolyngbya ohadii]|uniref:response regulator n=1 Tax=Leptolyngbya ohadii TaxID=1962290 RepID=UPI000B599163|nr:response regulator [Leptolyngbya ohadii]